MLQKYMLGLRGGLRFKLASVRIYARFNASLKGEDGGSGSGNVLVLEQVLTVA